MKYILLLLVLPCMTSCFISSKTRKPQSDLKTETTTVHLLHKNVKVHTLEIVKVDTVLNLFKDEVLFGFKVKGQIAKGTDSEAIAYFDKIHFIEAINYINHKQTIDIIPQLKYTNPKDKRSKPTKSTINYTHQDDKTLFEFYVEKKIYINYLGKESITFVCGELQETVSLTRTK